MDAMSVLNSDSSNIVRISVQQYNSLKVSQAKNHVTWLPSIRGKI